MPDDNARLIDRFLAYMRVERGAAENTISAYEIDLRKFSGWLSRPLTDAKKIDLQRYLAELLAAGSSSSSVARRRTCLRSFYRFLCYSEEIEADPTRHVPIPRGWKKVRTFLSTSEVERMVSSCGTSKLGLRDRAMLLLFFSSGLRASELAALKLADLDLDAGCAKVWDGKGHKDGIVPLSPPAIEALKAYLEIRSSANESAILAMRAEGNSYDAIASKLGIGAMTVYRIAHHQCKRLQADSPYVFPGRGGSVLTRENIWHQVRGIGKKVLGRDVSPHSLRRAYATALLKGGADIRDVQALMRHAGVDTTSLYIQLDLNFLRKTYYDTHPRALLTEATCRRLSNVLPRLKPKPEHDSGVPERPLLLLGSGRS